MHEKVQVLIFLIYMSKKGNFGEDLFFCLLLSSSSLAPNFLFYYNNISMPWAPTFLFSRAPLLPLPPQNPLDHVSG